MTDQTGGRHLPGGSEVVAFAARSVLEKDAMPGETEAETLGLGRRPRASEAKPPPPRRRSSSGRKRRDRKSWALLRKLMQSLGDQLRLPSGQAHAHW